MCALRRFRSACAFADSDQNLHWVHFGDRHAQFLYMDSEDSYRIARMCRLIWVSVECTGQKIRFFTLRLLCLLGQIKKTNTFWLKTRYYLELVLSRVTCHILTCKAEVGNILSWRFIMKYFLRSFSPFLWFKKGSCQFLAIECAQYWLTA